MNWVRDLVIVILRMMAESYMDFDQDIRDLLEEEAEQSNMFSNWEDVIGALLEESD